MGVFAAHQPLYAARGIATFPITPAKKPAVAGYAKIGLNGSGQLAMKFPESDGLAFLAGNRSRLSIVDIDSSDDGLLRDSLRRFGDTPVIVQTPSGGWHLWYRHGGEARKIRPEPSVPVDVLGGGPVIAPPSKGARASYEFVRGGLDAVDRLLPAANVIPFPTSKVERPSQMLIAPGGRNEALRDYLRSQARYCDDLDALIDVARTFADERLDKASAPFPDIEIIATARSVWDWTCEMIAAGTYFVGTGQRLTLTFDKLDRVQSLGPDALALFIYLQRHSGDRGDLLVANDLRLSMPGGEWTLVRFRKARMALLGAGLIAETRKASSSHGPARYAWGQG